MNATGLRDGGWICRAAVAVLAVVCAAVLAFTSGPSTVVSLTADSSVYYIRGLQIGRYPPDGEYEKFVDGMVDALVGARGPTIKVDYPGSLWPISSNFFQDPTFDVAIAEGKQSLADTLGGDTGVVHGYSEGAVVATRYKREHPDDGNRYILVASPNRPNGGIFERLSGLYIPILDISLDGATPTTGDRTYDIARQYDGWADFPKYPLNLLADLNAVLGVYYLHGKYDLEVDPADLENPAKTAKQVSGTSTYYLIRTDRLPLLRPLDGIVPEPVLDALDAPLRVLVELGYDRSDYGKPTGFGLFPDVSPVKVVKDLVNAVQQGAPSSAPPAATATLSEPVAESTATARPAARKADTAKRIPNSGKPLNSARQSRRGHAPPVRKPTADAADKADAGVS